MASRKMWRLSPLLAFIEDHTARGAIRYGVFHRLTGEALFIPEQLKEILLCFKDDPAPASDLDLLRQSPISQEAFSRFEQGHFLVTSINPDALLRPFLDYRLFVPAMNPAITFREHDGQVKMIRLEQSHVCYLPRTEATPPLTEELLPEAAAHLLRYVANTWTVRELIEHSREKMSTSEIWKAIDWLCDPARQLIRAMPANSDFRISKHPVHYLIQNLIPSAGLSGSGGGEMIEAKSFYQEQVSDVDWNFDWVETTICHSFRYPTRAFGQQTYGGRFCDNVLEAFGSGLQGLKQLDILEVGGGTGSFARAFLLQLQKYRERFGRINYSLMDCSRTMIDRQRGSLADVGITVRHLEQDAQEFSIPGERFHIIMANEMIADLKVAEAASGDINPPGQKPAPSWYHSGVFSFIDRLRDHLAPGGKAFLTEYEGLTEPSSPLAHLNHPEYPIHFGSIASHAERVGLRPTLRRLSDFLGVSREVEMLCGQQERYLCLNHLLSRHGERVPYAAFCRESFEQKWGGKLSDLGVGGIQFARLDEGLHFGPEFSQFQALILDSDS